MKVKLSQAVKVFFSNSSLEMVYLEAIANALDADATKIEIKISADSLSQPETLNVEITDNGKGFTDERYKKFSNLFDVNEDAHKGLGRLVYLVYFESIEVTSFYNQTKQRTFRFSEDFEESESCVTEVADRLSGTTFLMKGYVPRKIAKEGYVKPQSIKRRVFEEFYARLFLMKKQGFEVTINIVSTIEDSVSEASIKNSDMPDFESVDFDSPVTLIDKFTLYYSINESDRDPSLLAAITVDERTFKVDLITEKNLPAYEMVFLLYSEYFNGKIDATRQNLTIPKFDLKTIEIFFRKKVIDLIERKIPTIQKRNAKTRQLLARRYPHLGGYFETRNIGYISQNDIVKKAQDMFFKDQKELLEAESLTDEQFEKSFELSSRALTEYVLFRQITIQKLKNTTASNTEAELHKLFASKRKEGRFEKQHAIDDLYRNNAWLLDDKYMTYETVLSDREMKELIREITDGEKAEDADRPDIALIFSNNPADQKPFDVVIVELKRRGISLEENVNAITQLERRARKLMSHYKNQIQRIWFYGIIEFNEEVEKHLAGEYTELYSSGKMYYRETNVAISLNPRLILPIGVFVWDLDSVIKDADARNSAFLNLIKGKFTQE